MDITSIHRRPNFDTFPRHFQVLFRCNFADRKIHVVFTYFFRFNFDGQRIHVVSAYFFQCNFDSRKIYVVSTYFFRCNCSSRNIHGVSIYSFDVILMVEKSTLLASTFSTKFRLAKIQRRFLVSCKLVKTFEGGFPLLSAFKKLTLQHCSL